MRWKISGTWFLHQLINFTLALLYLLFLRANISAFVNYGNIGALVLVIHETLFIIFFLIRTNHESVSKNPLDWAVAISGSFISTALRPGTGQDLLAGNLLILFSVVLTIPSILSLNRSLGLVPAKRIIKTGGMYLLVRHPMYLSYLFLCAGYFINNFTVNNFVVISAFIFLMFWRIKLEESFLMQDIKYKAYAEKVIWKIIPFVY